MRTPAYIADFDSASGMLRALARFLHGKDFPAVGTPRPLWPIMASVNALPKGAREAIYVWSGWWEAIPPERIDEVRAEEMARWAVSLYPRRTYPAAMIGSSDGAAVHLCAALGIPWLPQTFLIPVRQTGIALDEPRQALEWGKHPGRRLLVANPDLQLHHMHDVNQDRSMLQKMTYFRVKRLGLGEVYTRFLEEALPPGATLFLLECEQRWPTTLVGERQVFQHGAVGGLAPDEYLHGSPRVAEYLQRHGAPLRRWDSPEPDAERPEAEWGFEPALRDDVERLARRRGYRVRRIVFEAPGQPSSLVADLYRWWYRRRRIPADRLLVESFILVEPWWALRTGSVPFWMTFNVESSAESLERYLDGAQPFDEILLTLFANGTEGVGLAPIERWRAILSRAGTRGRFVGVDERAFPRDFAVFVRFHRAMRRVPGLVPMPEPLALPDLDAFLHEAADRYPVRWLDETG